MAAIVALVPPDTKATRRIDKTPLNPNGRKLRKFEKDGEARLYEALQKWGRALFRGVTADTVALLTARLDDPEFNKPLRDVLIMFLQDVADAGAEHGREQVERVFMGVKRIPDVAAGAVDWTAANADAAQWAIEYGYQLIGGITDTTRAQIAREIRYFVDNGITINQLRDRLMAGNLFSRSRAEMIAVTEVTRAFAEGNEAAWRTSKVVEKKEWMTAFDEIVCPICGPLSGMIVPINESFGRINKPPAHPRCRCYILPVVAGDDEVLSPVGLGPWSTGGAGPVANVPQLTFGRMATLDEIGDTGSWLVENEGRDFTEEEKRILLDEIEQMRKITPQWMPQRIQLITSDSVEIPWVAQAGKDTIWVTEDWLKGRGLEAYGGRSGVLIHEMGHSLELNYLDGIGRAAYSDIHNTSKVFWRENVEAIIDGDYQNYDSKFLRHWPSYQAQASWSEDFAESYRVYVGMSGQNGELGPARRAFFDELFKRVFK